MREVLIHLNVEVPEDYDDVKAKIVAVNMAIDAAKTSREAFEDLIALVDPT